MNLILFDGPLRNHLLPFTYTRPLAAMRIGILTIAEKWEKHLETKPSYYVPNYLADKYKLKVEGDNLLVNGALCPDMRLLGKIIELKKGEGLYQGEVLLAARLNGEDAIEYDNKAQKRIEFEQEVTLIDRMWKIFTNNASELARDFDLITAGRTSANLSDTNTLIGDNIFVEEGGSAEGAIINAKDAPVYIGKGATIMEGSLVRNGLALCDNSALKMGAKIYGSTTIGPHSKVGGEVNNSVIFGYSNKGHDGFLGNSVLGEWCNIGADSNNSNLKNNYDEVKLWSYVRGGFERTGEQFCGLMMADHSKCGINTMFNTVTVVGVSANIYGAGFPRNFIPSYAWGGPQGFSEYNLDKALATAKRVMARRNIILDEKEEAILTHIFQETKANRNF
jgi:UDP-N-acetylglucosamine diphosphorylase/glucosamine-1-phosphate N-acetyltransferase